jgi:AraC-like DNA-binding protein
MHMQRRARAFCGGFGPQPDASASSRNKSRMYLERPASPALSSIVACTWLQRAQHASVERVVPDACMDILWDGAELTVAGPDTGPVGVPMPAHRQLVALRFAPGIGAAILGVPASALCDARVPLVELWGDSARTLEDALDPLGSVQAVWASLERAVASRFEQARELDPLMLWLRQTLQPTAADGSALRAVAALRAVPEQPSVAQLARAAGVSERQLLRRARGAFGYGPKLLARILRFQAFRRALRDQPQASLAQLALELGYADQAHLTHDVSELAGVPPSQLKREARLASDFDKTHAAGQAHNARHEDDPSRTTHPR